MKNLLIFHSKWVSDSQIGIFDKNSPFRNVDPVVVLSAFRPRFTFNPNFQLEVALSIPPCQSIISQIHVQPPFWIFDEHEIKNNGYILYGLVVVSKVGPFALACLPLLAEFQRIRKKRGSSFFFVFLVCVFLLFSARKMWILYKNKQDSQVGEEKGKKKTKCKFIVGTLFMRFFSFYPSSRVFLYFLIFQFLYCLRIPL